MRFVCFMVLTVFLAVLLVRTTALADSENPMQTILGFKHGFKDQSVFDNLAIRSFEAYGMPVKQINYQWSQGKFLTNVTFGSGFAPQPRLADSSSRLKSVLDEAEYPYLVCLPEQFDESRQYPMLLFLHGIGERGGTPAGIAKYGPFQYVLQGKSPEMIIIAPHLEPLEHWVEDENEAETDRHMPRLKTFINQMTEKYPIRPGQIFLSGLSMGGRGAYKLACYSPDTFAALVVCCGRTSKADQPEHFVYDLSKMSHIRTWVFHGLSDRTVNPNHSIRTVEKLVALNEKGDFRLTLYPGVGHNSFEIAYMDDELYAWLLFSGNN